MVFVLIVFCCFMYIGIMFWVWLIFLKYWFGYFMRRLFLVVLLFCWLFFLVNFVMVCVGDFIVLICGCLWVLMKVLICLVMVVWCWFFCLVICLVWLVCLLFLIVGVGCFLVVILVGDLKVLKVYGRNFLLVVFWLIVILCVFLCNW